MEVFSTGTGGSGWPPPRCAWKVLQFPVCEKPGSGAVPSALPSGQRLASQG